MISSRRQTFRGALFDALRGRSEKGDGQALSDIQVETLTPFLSDAYRLPPQQVGDSLRAARIYVGGAAADRGGQTVAMGSDIYVTSELKLAFITSWRGRRLLTHELGHTMQALRIPERRLLPAGGALRRMRVSALNYTLGLFVDNRWRAGALPRAGAKWIGDRLNRNRRDRRRPFRKDAHDLHHLEIEAETHARRFRDLTEPG